MSKVAVCPGASGVTRSTRAIVPLSRGVIWLRTGRAVVPVTWSNLVKTLPPSKFSAPKRESGGKMYELSDPLLNAFCSVWIQM